MLTPVLQPVQKPVMPPIHDDGKGNQVLPVIPDGALFLINNSGDYLVTDSGNYLYGV